MIRTTLGVCLVLAVFTTATPAQNDKDQVTKPNSGGAYAPSQLVLRYHPVKGSRQAVSEILAAAQQAFGREILTEDGGRRNLFSIGQSIAILEVPERAETILRALPELERVAAPVRDGDAPAEKIEWTIIQCSYAEVASLRPALAPFEREVFDAGRNTGNIHFLPAANSIMVRDTPSRIKEIQKVIAALDVRADTAQPVVMTLSFQILRAASAEEKTGPEIDAELASNLRRLGPWTHFNLMGSAMVRVASERGSASVGMELAANYMAQLELSGVRPDGDEISIPNLALDIRNTIPKSGMVTASTSLKTSTRVKVNEYTVVGAAGEMPFLLVIRATR